MAMGKAFSIRICRSSLAVSFFLFSCGLGMGQSAVSSGAAPSSAPSPLLLQFEQTQQTIGQQLAQLMAQGATSAQLTFWINQNQSLLQAQQTRALQLGAISAAQPLPYVTSVTIPEDASQDLEDFLTTRATLANDFAQIHNQLLQQGAVSAATESTLFQQQAGATLQAQAQLAQKIAAEQVPQPLPVPPPLNLPPNASPQLAAFLTARDQLMRNGIALFNQYVTATPAVRQAALQQWEQQNAAQIQQVQQLAQNLSNSSTN
jgi:hypothetical protein